MHWDWDWHYQHHWHRPWDSYMYHYKCPVRTRFGPSMIDCDWDFHYNDFGYALPEWCHHTCLSGRVYIETGDEDDTCGKGTYKVILDVHHFKATELKLKVKNNDILIVEGKFSDERASKSPALCVATEFTRKYKLPRNYDATLAKATLSKDGILTIMVAPPPPLDDVERDIEIQQTDSYFGSTESNGKDKALENGKDKEAIMDAKDDDSK